MCQGLNSHYFHVIGDKLINPIVGVYIPIKRIPIKGGIFPIPIATFDHGTYVTVTGNTDVQWVQLVDQPSGWAEANNHGDCFRLLKIGLWDPFQMGGTLWPKINDPPSCLIFFKTNPKQNKLRVPAPIVVNGGDIGSLFKWPKINGFHWFFVSPREIIEVIYVPLTSRHCFSRVCTFHFFVVFLVAVERKPRVFRAG